MDRPSHYDVPPPGATAYDQAVPATVILDRRPDGEPTRPCLVVVRAGPGSLHKTWFGPGISRQWDFMVNYWCKDPAGDDPHAEIIVGGGFSKLLAIGELHETHPLLFGSYRAVLLLDDDHDLDPHRLDVLFELFEAYDLLLAHPAIATDTFSAYRSHFQQPGLALRYVNFVEVMAPLFSQAAFLTCAETFEMSRSGWGACHIWPHLLGYPERGIGIIDAYAIRHTKPVDRVGGALYNYLTARGVDPLAERIAVPALYGLKPIRTKTLASIPLEEGLARIGRA